MWDALDLELTRWEQVDSWNWTISNGHESLGGVHIDTSEQVEIVEDGPVRGSHGELNLGQLRQNTKEPHLVLAHDHLLVNLRWWLAC